MCTCKHTLPDNLSLQSSYTGRKELRVRVCICVELVFPMSKINTSLEVSHYVPSVSINCLGTNLHSSIIACVTLLSTGHVGFELTTLPLQQGPEFTSPQSRPGFALLIPSSFISKALSLFPANWPLFKNKQHVLIDQHKVEILACFQLPTSHLERAHCLDKVISWASHHQERSRLLPHANSMRRNTILLKLYSQEEMISPICKISQPPSVQKQTLFYTNLYVFIHTFEKKIRSEIIMMT